MRVDADHVVARIDSHAPEWIRSTNEADVPDFVTHCGWGQGGVHLAPVKWVGQRWWRFGLLVVRRADQASPVRVKVYRPGRKKAYRTFALSGASGAWALPPGRYRLGIDGQAPAEATPIEIMADQRTYHEFN